jgi:hypothetical protein
MERRSSQGNHTGQGYQPTRQTPSSGWRRLDGWCSQGEVRLSLMTGDQVTGTVESESATTGS